MHALLWVLLACRTGRSTPTTGSVPVGLGFVLLQRADLPDGARVEEQAALLGLTGLEASDTNEPDILELAWGPDGQVFVMMVPMPQPDLASLSWGPTSPDRRVAEDAPAHLIVSWVREDALDPLAADAQFTRLMAAVIAATPSLGALVQPGISFYEASHFHDTVRKTPQGELPITLCVDATLASEAEGRISFLTHGMDRYGREELMVTAPMATPGEAYSTLYGIAMYLLESGALLPTGDTVGRTPEERIVVQRVVHPTEPGVSVIRLDL